jgi:hypothetical protein
MMSIFHLRTTKPSESRWFEVEGESLVDAVTTFHLKKTPYLIPAYIYRHEYEPGSKEIIYFSRVEIQETNETVIARTYHRGITRRGGIKPPPSKEDTIEGIAELLGWKRPAHELLETWEGEESWEDAEKNR